MNGESTVRERNVNRAAALDTATISDALDRLGLVGQCRGILPRDPSFRLAGRAYTLRYAVAANPPGTVGDYIDDVPAGSVLVLDNAGRSEGTVWGDILTEVAHRREIAGTVIDGICRDVSLCIELGYPVFSAGQWMRTGKDRVQLEATNVPVSIGGVRVEPGDLLRGDADGVVCIARAVEERVLTIAEEIASVEDDIRVAARGGMRLDEARRQFAYHRLQSRERATS
jgi:regulator of RNase E activity RraA